MRRACLVKNSCAKMWIEYPANISVIIAERWILIHGRTGRPCRVQKTRFHVKIEILYKTELEEILGTDKVEKVRFQEGTGGEMAGQELELDGVFMAIGHIAQTDIAKELGVELNEKGEIKINRRSETNLKGVFAAGDCCDTGFKQAITGSAEGVTASYYAYHVCQSGAAS